MDIVYLALGMALWALPAAMAVGCAQLGGHRS